MLDSAKLGQGARHFLANLPDRLAQSRNGIIAFVMLLSYVAMITTSSQLTSIAFQQSVHFKAPFLFILFKMLFRTLAFPLWLLVDTLTRLCRGRRVVLIDTWRHCEEICGMDGITWRVLAWKFTPTALTMLLMQIGYTLGLTYLSTSMTTALYCSAVAISYGLTWVFFKRPLLIIKSIFVLLSFAGVGLIAYANFTVKIDLMKTIIGIVASLLSAIFLSFHQISFMKAFPRGDLGQVSFALSGMNIFICLIYWPVPLAMKLTGYEVYDISEMPAGLVVASWACTGISSTTAGYGLILSSPFFMSVGELLILAANSVLDVTVRHLVMSQNQMIGTILIGVAFLVLVIPDACISISCFCLGNKNDEDLKDDLDDYIEHPAITTIEGLADHHISAPADRRRSTMTDARRASLAFRRKSSAFGRSVRRMSKATGVSTDTDGNAISYEFYPSSEPSMILSSRKNALPVGLPEPRLNGHDIAEGARRMSAAAGRRMSYAARRMSTLDGEILRLHEEKPVIIGRRMSTLGEEGEGEEDTKRKEDVEK